MVVQPATAREDKCFACPLAVHLADDHFVEKPSSAMTDAIVTDNDLLEVLQSNRLDDELVDLKNRKDDIKTDKR